MPTENFHTLKLSSVLLAELGATPADFADKLAAFIADSKATKVSLASAETAATASASAGADLAPRLSAVEKSVADFKLVDGAALLVQCTAAAKAEASATATAILAKGGGAPIPPGNPPAPVSGAVEFKALVAAKMTAGKSKADAITAAITEQPAQYAAWRAAGAGSL